MEKARRLFDESFGDGVVGFRLPHSAVKNEADADGEEKQTETPKAKTSRGGKRKSAA